jgi:hypothetical protein
MLRGHFGPGGGSFAMQQVDLAGGRTALLVSRVNEADPIVLTVDRDELAWAKPRPIAGIKPPVMHVTLAPRPDGGVALFVYVASLHTLAARMWAEDGNPYAEIELASFDACDALSAAYASGVGWIIACLSSWGTRAQRLREDGTTAWDREGASMGAQTAAGPTAIAFDTKATWVVFQRVKGAGADHLLAWRYDGQGWPLWPAPIDVGPLPVPVATPGGERLEANALRDGAVRVELPRGLASKGGKAVEIASDGGVRVVMR